MSIHKLDKGQISALPESWDILKQSAAPVCIYGMGDACQRLLAEFDRRQIRCAAVFASDDFVRGQSFCGYRVCTLAELERKYGSVTVCCAFGSSLAEVMRHIADIAAKHTLIFPELAIAGEKLFSKAELLGRFDEVEDTYNILADERSRGVFLSLICFKITGDIGYLQPIFTDPDEDMRQIFTFEENEVFADLGAYNGDTAQKFITLAGESYERIYLFEPDKRSFRKCLKNHLRRDNVTFINACAWSGDCVLGFSQSAGRQSKISDGGEKICARSLDSVVGGGRCTFIKYDVEGAEKQAITGSAATIRRCKPKLFISAYHRPFDLIEIPRLVKSINSEYKLYLRQPPYFPAWDTAFYAV